MKLFAIIFGAILAAAAVIAGVIGISNAAKEREDNAVAMLASSSELAQSFMRTVELTAGSDRDLPVFSREGGAVYMVAMNGKYYTDMGMKTDRVKSGIRALRRDYEALVRSIRDNRPDKAKYADELEREVAVAFKDY